MTVRRPRWHSPQALRQRRYRQRQGGAPVPKQQPGRRKQLPEDLHWLRSVIRTMLQSQARLRSLRDLTPEHIRVLYAHLYGIGVPVPTTRREALLPLAAFYCRHWPRIARSPELLVERWLRYLRANNVGRKKRHAAVVSRRPSPLSSSPKRED